MDQRKNSNGRPATRIESERASSLANLQDKLNDMKQSRNFYRSHIREIEAWSANLPEPYKAQLAKILATTLEGHANNNS